MREIKWNLKAFEEIRKTAETQAMLQKVVDGVLEEIGDRYKGEVNVGEHRTAGRVWTAGTYAARSNALHNTLVTALADGGRHL